ncbi:MAG: cardiolipin synthase [Oscillospiraceae bacterium]|nr:cardiolipin synthase [Oscillospiraceae bacterium]
MEENVVRLAKPRKKGLLYLVFSRFFIIALLIALQIAFYVMLAMWLREYLPHYAIVQALFGLVMVIFLFNSRMDYSAKLTWLALIAVFPLAGALMLAYTQNNLGQRAVKKRSAELINQTKHSIAQDTETIEGLKGDPYASDDLHKYLCRSGCFPIYRGTQARYFPLGENVLEAMLPELEKAEKFIFLEFFIIEEGYMWGRVLDVLTRKAAAGVDVRVMYDGMSDLFNLPPNYTKLLAAKGIKAKAFAPMTPFVSTHYNYRDHRKIMVIDGKVAFNGGVNLADEYINRTVRFGHWKDSAVMLKGSAVASFTLLFLQMWNLTEKEAEFPDELLVSPAEEKADGFVMPYGDSPLDEEKVGENVYMDFLNRAVDYVHIMTPYLILDGELEASLKYAAERGVDVQLILPGIPDKKVAYALAKSHYAALTEAGVKIYEYTPGFVHSKVFVSDGVRAVVGTINLDYRSLYHHFECATYLYRNACIPEIEQDFQDTLAKCRAVTPESIRNEKLGYKLLGPLLKIISPLM